METNVHTMQSQKKSVTSTLDIDAPGAIDNPITEALRIHFMAHTAIYRIYTERGQRHGEIRHERRLHRRNARRTRTPTRSDRLHSQVEQPRSS